MIPYDAWVRRARPKLARTLFHKEWEACRTDERATVQAAADRLFPLVAIAAARAVALADLVQAVDVP